MSNGRALDFWIRFRTAFEKATMQTDQWREYWSDASQWTAFMQRILRSVGQELYEGSDAVSCEYFRIDMCYFSYSNSYSNSPKRPHTLWWNLDVAVEHENNGAEWLCEWVKLLRISCGLRVVISYDDTSRGLESLKPNLDRAAELASCLKYRASGESLVILGPWANEPRGQFIALAYDGHRFQELLPVLALRPLVAT